MPMTRTFFFILGFVVAWMETSAARSNDNGQNVSTTATPATTTNIMINLTSNVAAATSTMSITNNSITNNTSSTITPLSTKPHLTHDAADENSKGDKAPKTPTPTPMKITQTTLSTLSTITSTASINTNKAQQSDDSTGIIIVVVIILVALGFGVMCYISRRRARRQSVDFTSRPDEANIPLSTMEPELHVDTVSQNGLQTFESVENHAKEPQEQEAKPEVKEEQKAEAEKSADEPSAESAAPAPTPDSSEDKPKDDVTEQSPPAPVEASVEEKTDDEGVASTETSVESLKETNQNNSNNADFSQKWDLNSGDLFWDVPLNCPL